MLGHVDGKHPVQNELRPEDEPFGCGTLCRFQDLAIPKHARHKSARGRFTKSHRHFRIAHCDSEPVRARQRFGLRGKASDSPLWLRPRRLHRANPQCWVSNYRKFPEFPTSFPLFSSVLLTIGHEEFGELNQRSSLPSRLWPRLLELLHDLPRDLARHGRAALVRIHDGFE